MLSLECALKRSPVVRAKRKCIFQRAAVRSPDWKSGASCFARPWRQGWSFLGLLPTMVLAAGGSGSEVFRFGLLQLRKGYSLSPVVHFHGSVLPFTHPCLALRGPIAPLASRLQLQRTALVPDHPVVADRSLGLYAENLAKLAGGRLSPVIVLRLCRRPGKTSVVLPQIP